MGNDLGYIPSNQFVRQESADMDRAFYNLFGLVTFYCLFDFLGRPFIGRCIFAQNLVLSISSEDEIGKRPKLDDIPLGRLVICIAFEGL